jgi:hypothetical protein
MVGGPWTPGPKHSLSSSSPKQIEPRLPPLSKTSLKGSLSTCTVQLSSLHPGRSFKPSSTQNQGIPCQSLSRIKPRPPRRADSDLLLIAVSPASNPASQETTRITLSSHRQRDYSDYWQSDLFPGSTKPNERHSRDHDCYPLISVSV